MLSKKELNGCNECLVHGETTRSQLEVMARRTELFRTALESGVQHGWAAFIKKRPSMDAIHCANPKNTQAEGSRSAMSAKRASGPALTLMRRRPLKHHQLYRYQLGDCPLLVFQLWCVSSGNFSYAFFIPCIFAQFVVGDWIAVR